MNSSRYLAPISIALASFLLGAAAVYFVFMTNAPQAPTPSVAIQNFEQCATAGYPVMESYPRQCRTPSGTLFVEQVTHPTPPPSTTPPTPPTPPVSGCIIGGCSRELCTDAANGSMMSSCIYRAEFTCYKNAMCERQSDGQCGWTQTPGLKSCLAHPPALQ